MTRPLFSLVLLPIVAGCAADPTVYPSLAPRPVEKLGFEEPATPPPAPAAPDPALDAEVTRAVTQRTEAAQAFDRGATRAERLARAARGAAVGSDRWIEAQTAIAELDALRSAHADTIGTLEELAAARAARLQPDYAPLERALTEARAAAAAQTARIDAAARSLPGG